MEFIDYTGWLLFASVALYWIGVGVMIVRVRRKTKRLGGLVPERVGERVMWLLWAPLVAAWIASSFSAASHGSAWLGSRALLAMAPVLALRSIAALAALLCLALTVRCWAQMGQHWSMDISERNRALLFTDGAFARVRHPIYALSIALMICSVIVVATMPMLIVAPLHIALMFFKAASEERHLLRLHGDAYGKYVRRTGRFFPRWSGEDVRA